MRLLLFLLFLLPVLPCDAQNMKAVRTDVRTLTGAALHGRGYVDKGAQKASTFLLRKLREAGLEPVGREPVYTQTYRLWANTFPGAMALQLNRRVLKPGVEYLVDARSAGYAGERQRLRRVDVRRVFRKGDSATRARRLSARGGAVLLRHADTLTRGTFLRTIAGDSLDRGLYVVPVRGKMTWTVRSETFAGGATVAYVQDSALPRWPRRVTASIAAKLAQSEQLNVMAQVRGTAVPDSYLVFTAHYDHLGEMGNGVLFPGASDNASGTAAVLDIARYFARNPQRYSVLFLFFSGEEAGLVGSKYFVEHPAVPLDRIKFLLNLDMVGEAADGATVVNATRHPEQFRVLQQLNSRELYVRKLVSRGEAANSDHYPFSQAGVPCFFLYGNGGKGHYHDVFDTAADLSLEGTEGIEKLLIRFAETLGR